MQQLRHFATLGGNGTSLSPVLQAFQTDSALAPALAARLQAALAPLLAVPDSDADWHPGTGRQVLNLVHPSMYPVIFGITKAVPPAKAATSVGAWRSQIGRGAVVQAHDARGTGTDGEARETALSHLSAQQHQWLPAEVAIAPSGQASFESYINNLLPEQNAELYTALEELLTAALPTLEATLTHADALSQPAIDATGYPVYAEHDGAYSTDGSHNMGGGDGGEPRVVAMPAPPDVYEPQPSPEPYSLRGRRLQVRSSHCESQHLCAPVSACASAHAHTYMCASGLQIMWSLHSTRSVPATCMGRDACAVSGAAAAVCLGVPHAAMLITCCLLRLPCNPAVGASSACAPW